MGEEASAGAGVLGAGSRGNVLARMAGIPIVRVTSGVIKKIPISTQEAVED